MEMTGKYCIHAPRDAVWTALNDTEILKHCLRGCERLERIDEFRMAGTVTTKFGSVKATFNGEAMLSEVDQPNGYRIAGEGKAGPAGFVNGGAKVELHEDGDGTVLTYTVDAALKGKLAQLGSRVVDAAAKKMADDFFKRFANEVTQDATSLATTKHGTPSDAPMAANLRRFGSLSQWWLLLGVAIAGFVLVFAFSQ